MEPLVSIIVPVYNLEGYVTNCLNSLVNQTYRNLEILCIDDGSTDKSADVIKTFAEKDDRVIYLYKENGGVSSARNMGLDMFKGEYVMFVDGDDYLHPQAVEVLVNVILALNYDLIVFEMLETDESSIFRQPLSNVTPMELDIDVFLKSVKPICLLSGCNKIYSKDVLAGKRFIENLSRSEDTVFFFSLLNKTEKICYINQILYYYYLRQGSATRVGFDEKMVNSLAAYSSVCQILLKDDSNIVLGQLLLFAFKYLFALRTLCIGTSLEREILLKCRSFGKKWLIVFLKNKFISLDNKAIVTLFYYCPVLYELVRLIKDPTMVKFYLNRKHR